MKIYKKNQIEEVASLLKEGEVVAFPTETVFGLGVISSSKEAFLKLVNVKKRSPNKPFTLMISSFEQVKEIVELNDLAKKIINKFCPGELTIILKAKEGINDYLDLKSGFVGIRMPNDKFMLELISKVNEPLLVPSCNPKDMVPAKTVEEVINYFDGKINGVVEGKSVSNIPSTVIKIDGENISLIREGNIKFDEILKEIKR